MLTPEEDVEVTSLRKRGSTISAIARHVGHDRKTVRSYLSVEREPSVRERAKPDVFDRFEPYVRQRLVDDQHVWGTTLFDEVVALGYDPSYQTFTRKLRERDLRPHCEPCSASHGRAYVDIEHPPGAEIQWDWLELDETSSTRAPAGCSSRLRPSPSITASVSMRARRGTATARVSSRRTSAS